jgi:spore coat protein U-like protein
LNSRFLLLLLLLWAGHGLAQGCSIRVIALQFGNYNPLFGGTLDATGDVFVTCDSAVPYSITIDAGIHSGGNFGSRRMERIGGGDFLTYNIFRDPGRIEIWGDGSGSTFVQAAVSTGIESRFIAYGRLPAGQNVSIGTYTDSLSVLVEW